jgi:hypothetical protein
VRVIPQCFCFLLKNHWKCPKILWLTSMKVFSVIIAQNVVFSGDDSNYMCGDHFPSTISPPTIGINEFPKSWEINQRTVLSGLIVNICLNQLWNIGHFGLVILFIFFVFIIIILCEFG